jgi:pantetheine-phosphate adenylyltransferase
MLKIAVYPGSFDPITNGHLDIVRRVSQMFDRVIVAVAVNQEKSPLFSGRPDAVGDRSGQGTKERVGGQIRWLARELRPQQARERLVRGLRAVSDFEFEFQLALMNRKLDSGIETIFLMTKDEYTFISSRQVKEICRLGADVSDFVPRGVERALRRRFGSKSSD